MKERLRLIDEKILRFTIDERIVGVSSIFFCVKESHDSIRSFSKNAKEFRGSLVPFLKTVKESWRFLIFSFFLRNENNLR